MWCVYSVGKFQTYFQNSCTILIPTALFDYWLFHINKILVEPVNANIVTI
jgi:hypothetical protein